jgi:hypothetical protein
LLSNNLLYSAFISLPQIEHKRKREEEMSKHKDEKLKSLPEEPEVGDPNSTHIIFRYRGSRRSERRFLP